MNTFGIAFRCASIGSATVVRGRLATVPLLAPQDMFAPALAMHITRKHLTPKNRSAEY